MLPILWAVLWLASGRLIILPWRHVRLMNATTSGFLTFCYLSASTKGPLSRFCLIQSALDWVTPATPPSGIAHDLRIQSLSNWHPFAR